MFQEIKFYATNSISREMIEWAYNKVREPNCHYIIEIHYYEGSELNIYYVDGSRTPSQVFSHPFIVTHDRCVSSSYREHW